MAEELLESEAIEEPEPDGGDFEEASARRLPDLVRPGSEISIWRDEVKTVALAAGAGIVAGAATVAVVRAARGSTARRAAPRRALLRRDPPQRVVASRSFLVDVHLLGSK